MEHLFTADSIISFVILVVLEIVLGIDNVIFVSIIINRLPKKEEKKARRAWMIMGIIMRSLLLMGLGGLLVSDLMRNMWAWDNQNDYTSGLTSMLVNAIGGK